MNKELESIVKEIDDKNPKEPCTLDMAKRLKKLGFDMLVHHYYLTKELPFCKPGLKSCKNDGTFNHNGYDEFVYSAPTHGEIKKWVTDMKSKKEGINYWLSLNNYPKGVHNIDSVVWIADIIEHYNKDHATDTLKKLLSIMERCKASISLTVNSYKDSYESVKEYLESLTLIGNLDIGEDIDEDVYDKIIETGTLIEFTCYPDTPVGNYTVYGYDLNMVINEMAKALKI